MTLDYGKSDYSCNFTKAAIKQLASCAEVRMEPEFDLLASRSLFVQTQLQMCLHLCVNVQNELLLIFTLINTDLIS